METQDHAEAFYQLAEANVSAPGVPDFPTGLSSFAQLPGRTVHAACMQTITRVDQKWNSVLHKRSSNEHPEQYDALGNDLDRLRDLSFKIGVLAALAWAARDGTVAVSAEDFKLIESHYDDDWRGHREAYKQKNIEVGDLG